MAGSELQALADDVLREMAKRAVESVLADKYRWSMDNGQAEIGKILAVSVRKMIDEPEIQEMIREALISWIKKQTTVSR